MKPVCKLFYRKDVYTDRALPIYVANKTVVGQNDNVVEHIENYGQVTYYDGEESPHIRGAGDGDPAAGRPESLRELLPDEIPEAFAGKLPPSRTGLSYARALRADPNPKGTYALYRGREMP